jgi:hypothetical protein
MTDAVSIPFGQIPQPKSCNNRPSRIALHFALRHPSRPPVSLGDYTPAAKLQCEEPELLSQHGARDHSSHKHPQPPQTHTSGF